ELGSVQAHFSLGNADYEGEGVQEEKAKAIQLWTKAAMQGHAESRHNLGCIEKEEKGNHDRAVRHFLISAKVGYKTSLEVVKRMFMGGVATKEQYAEALKGYQDAVEEMKSHDRDEAKRLWSAIRAAAASTPPKSTEHDLGHVPRRLVRGELEHHPAVADRRDDGDLPPVRPEGQHGLEREDGMDNVSERSNRKRRSQRSNSLGSSNVALPSAPAHATPALRRPDVVQPDPSRAHDVPVKQQVLRPLARGGTPGSPNAYGRVTRSAVNPSPSGTIDGVRRRLISP
ncbi:hypothetical protein THAOC_27495, partial [Thalassiosira oceanica]